MSCSPVPVGCVCLTTVLFSEIHAGDMNINFAL